MTRHGYPSVKREFQMHGTYTASWKLLSAILLKVFAPLLAGAAHGFHCQFLLIVQHVDGNIDKTLGHYYQQIKDEFSKRWAKHKCEVN